MGTAIEIEELSDVILYDGACKFCNNTVNFIIKNENSAGLNFASLQSEISTDLAKKYNFDNKQLNTIVFIQNGKTSRYLNKVNQVIYLMSIQQMQEKVHLKV